MKSFLIIFSFLVLFTGFKNKTIEVPPSKGFALIELFTSEGCSSCPPAEDVMANIIAKSDTSLFPVYVIEFHVDYWDYLGWKDTFALHEYTDRQQKYADYFKLNSIYTPQAIINGKTEMVGSDEAKVNASINSVLQQTPLNKIICKATKSGNSKIVIDYSIAGSISEKELNIAVVESGLTTTVKKGENKARTLKHLNVARVFKTMPLNAPIGKCEINVPHINLNNAKIVCFLQNAKSMKITEATETRVVQ